MSPDKEGTHTIIEYWGDNEPVEGHSAYQLSKNPWTKISLG